ncbi:hypothetical protein LJ656_34355 [Paraburkholderia sp. MMS20-SJTR3]|uniref:Filamentous hemagglutinin n=1 Tax=Paraburkholderia sejongensis TaxID=2886946 RepID=A0ABS8K649_9BURK|nr:hypothetical protein [Paraburkholderia sp. MMS20-SJTR3]MCC8397628.1 hypothetical protein [Paraburkholderia sp. MMS20-SJTR3]
MLIKTLAPAAVFTAVPAMGVIAQTLAVTGVPLLQVVSPATSPGLSVDGRQV